MKTKDQYHLKVWELALLCSLCISLCVGAWAQNTQSELSDNLIRLHVLADSDSETEQAVKLRVRDAVLAYLEPLLENDKTVSDAAATIEGNLDGLKQAAASASEGREVSVTLSREKYPTRDYDGFSLPAGEYTSLRVVLGSGQGHNWWCVVFPPLCMGGSISDDPEAVAALGEEELAIITADSGEYAIKFRILEIWDWLSELIDTK